MFDRWTPIAVTNAGIRVGDEEQSKWWIWNIHNQSRDVFGIYKLHQGHVYSLLSFILIIYLLQKGFTSCDFSWIIKLLSFPMQFNFLSSSLSIFQNYRRMNAKEKAQFVVVWVLFINSPKNVTFIFSKLLAQLILQKTRRSNRRSYTSVGVLQKCYIKEVHELWYCCKVRERVHKLIVRFWRFVRVKMCQ